ncbi:MAG TPA: hypothetical protein VNE86_03010 [Nitrososphaerales archaeon]|nr:hypothetical protein [Nitrososphaerales archaeon]
MSFKKHKIERITTGSANIDMLLGGGLPIASITDVYGAAGTGKTQFAFQSVVMTCEKMPKLKLRAHAVFVDCTGSFRPERIAEIARSRSFNAEKILETTYGISVRTVEDQRRASQRVESDTFFSHCHLLVIDDVTANFVSEFKDEDIASRQTSLSMYMRQLAYLACRKGIPVLLTNSARSRGDLGEGESTGEILSQFSLHRMHFERKDRQRMATLMQPDLNKRRVKFEIETSGVV